MGVFMSKGRMANFELLRIVAMLMIIALHYLVKGAVAVPFEESTAAVNYAAWLIEALCIVAVNCYVLISGYFLVESMWKPGRVGSLVCRVLFYSLLIPVLLLIIGEVSPSSLGIYDWIGYLFPIDTEHYWFATAYLIMYLFAPFLAEGIKKTEKKQLELLIVLLLFFFSGVKTCVPVPFVTDRYGYDFGWFLCLFVIAGYLRRFGFPWLEKKAHAVSLYVLSALGIWAISVGSHSLAGKIQAFSYYEDMPYTYNYLLCVTGAVGLFYVFKDMKIGEGRAAKIICTLAPYTFGVYLLHEHILLRYEWMQWLKVDQVSGSFRFLPHMIMSVLLVYVVGTVVDFVREWIFSHVGAFAARLVKKQE